MTMANQTVNPFEEEKPKIVHLEKDQSHYEYCRMQMHEIEHVHRRTFFCNLGLCILVCVLAVFHVYIGGFDLLTGSGDMRMSATATIITVGIFQIIGAMIIILLGYLAWANYRSLNLILAFWYIIVVVIGIVRLDYATGIVGAVGFVFYYFSIKELRREESLSQMEGYPEFHEKLDISKSDFVVQTLLAHKGERMNKKRKSSLFTTDYSLRRTKKRKDSEDIPSEEHDAGTALAQELQKRIEEVQKPAASAAAEKAETAPATEDASEAAEKAETAPAAEAVSEKTEKAEADIMRDLVEEPAAEAAPEKADADAILAEAEERAKAILAEAVAKAQTLKAETPKADAKPQNRPQNRGGKKKRR